VTLHVENLTVHHGAIQALTNVSFDVKEGELTAVIGSNGAGKSTLLRTLSGLKSASNGTASWKGHNLLHGKAESHVRHGVAHVSEGKSVIPELTVEENLDLGALWRRNKNESASTKRRAMSSSSLG
jgi:branched-chain amino acid transport system ATP-binding protein